MTYPLIGNYGLTDEDYESKYLGVKGLVVKEYNEIPSNFRYTRTLGDVMEENNNISNKNISPKLQYCCDYYIIHFIICNPAKQALYKPYNRKKHKIFYLNI